MRTSLTALLVAATFGCAPRLEPGAPCSLTSDCPDRLICALERCRSMCAAAVDCDGRPCLIEDGIGSCQVAEDACTESSDCATGLECAAGRCTTRCSVDADCPGAACVGGTCRALTESDAGTPDAPLLDASPDAPRAFIPCADGRECAADEVCAGTLCHVTCDAGSDCPPGSACLMTPDVASGGICAPLCHPATSEGCPTGYTCSIVTTSQVIASPDTFTVCRLAGGNAAGCLCGGSVAPQLCGENLSCLEGSPSRCAEACEVGTTCADGSACGSAGGPTYARAGTTYRLCAPPPEPSGCTM